MLEIFAKERLVSKMQFIGDFLNAHFGRFQQSFSFQNNKTVYPFSGSLSTDFFYSCRKMLGCQKHFVGIIGNTAFLFVRLCNCTDKTLKKILFPAFYFSDSRLIALIDAIYLIEKRQYQSLSNLFTERIVFQFYLLLKERVILLHSLHLFRIEAYTGLLFNHKKQRE